MPTLHVLLLSLIAGAFVGADAPGAPKDKRDHWAYKPLVHTDPPAVKNPAWVKNPIDAYVLSKLESKNLSPAPPADRRTLIRRLSFDLTGLPPSPEEVEQFVNDSNPAAYEHLVDRLLASPRYGERWARHWLDVMHYGESHGYGMDRPRANSWPYRDYVIASFNADKPWARFVQEQVAGDVLYPDDPQGVVALGFVAAGPWNQSPQAEQNDDIACKKIAQNLDRDDMVVTTLTAFDSTTVNCARCHDHKFDPISQQEYYDLQAVFAGVDRADRVYDKDPEVFARRQLLHRQKLALQPGAVIPARLALPEMPTDAQLIALAHADDATQWTVLDPSSFLSAAGATLTKQPDHSVLAGGLHPDKDVYTLVTSTDQQQITAIRLDVLCDDSLPHHGPGRSENGNLSLTEFKVTAAPTAHALEAGAAQPVALIEPSADFNQMFAGEWDITKALDGNDNSGWSIYPEVNQPHFAVFRCKQPIGFPGGATLTFSLEQKAPAGHSLGRVRLSITTTSKPGRADAVPYPARKQMAADPAKASPAERAEMARLWRLKQVEDALAELPTPSKVYAITNDFSSYHNFHAAPAPRPIFVLKRGDIDHPADPATPGALGCMQNLPSTFTLSNATDEGQRRAALAHWLTSPDNVLTWRSIANRVWQYHFGKGIVETPNDFGHIGATPTHPELLDYLAQTLLQNGGSLKSLHRLIVTSNTYLQSSRFDPAAAAVDSGNQLLWHMNRTRLDAEEVRDTLLQITGKLDAAMGGPSVEQFKMSDPNDQVTPTLDYTNFDVDSAPSCRRSVYRKLYRTVPDPFMDCLDCADASQLTGKRNVSVTPLQALAMLNDRFVIRYSEHLAERVGKISSEPAAQIDAAYKLSLGRPASADERRTLSEYAGKYGMPNACRVILNSNEFLFVN